MPKRVKAQPFSVPFYMGTDFFVQTLSCHLYILIKNLLKVLFLLKCIKRCKKIRWNFSCQISSKVAIWAGLVYNIIKVVKNHWFEVKSGEFSTGCGKHGGILISCFLPLNILHLKGRVEHGGQYVNGHL